MKAPLKVGDMVVVDLETASNHMLKPHGKSWVVESVGQNSAVKLVGDGALWAERGLKVVYPKERGRTVRTRSLFGEVYRGVEFSTAGDNGNAYADLLHAAANYVEDRGDHGCVVSALNFTVNPDTDRLQLELVVGQ